MMTRKDSEKEADRPHYYSQFWLDVAAGRHVIGAPKPGDEGDIAEPELEPVAPRRMARPGSTNDHAASDGRRETLVHPVAHPVAVPTAEPDELDEPEADEVSTDDIPDTDEVSIQDFDVTDGDLPDMELDEDVEENADEDEESFDGDEEEEEEDEEDWGARGRKKAKPTRPVKPPVSKKPKRDRRY